MKIVSLRASLPSALLFVLLTAPAATAQTAVALPAGPSLTSQVAPLAGVGPGEGLVPAMSAAAGQRRSDPQAGGPMTVVPVRNAFVVAPEVRFGEVNHRSATFAGVTGGALLDNRLFVGAGGYWLANNEPGFEMGYAGAIVGWYLTGRGPIDVSLTGLVGGGWSTMTEVGAVPLGTDRHGHQMYPPPGGWYVTGDFFVAEPNANVCIRITRSVWINAGVGYRYVNGVYGLDHDLGGVTGSVAVTFGRR